MLAGLHFLPDGKRKTMELLNIIPEDWERRIDEDECSSWNRTHVLYCPHAWEGGHGSCAVLRVVRVGAAARVGPSAACGGDGCLNRPRG